jgi:outer membrane protein assembly factor BamA
MRLFCLFIFLFSVSVQAQNNNVVLQTDSSSFSMNDSIVTIGSITIKGNKITKDFIITRELEVFSGEQLSQSGLDDKLLKSQQNLMNRSLFNFVTISKNETNGLLNINVEVVERWYIWPIPLFSFADRNINAWLDSKDFSRLNYGLDIRIENFRGRMEYLNFIIQGGYDKLFAVEWKIPYLTKNQNFGMGMAAGIQLNRLYAYATENNKLVYFDAGNKYAAQQYFGSFDFTFRPKFNFLHTASISYHYARFNDSLLTLNPNFTYGDTIHNYFKLAYNYKHDFRDYAPYPLKGYYFDVGLEKTGLGILDDDVNLWNFHFAFDHYIHVYKHWFFAYNFSLMYSSSGFQPYFLSSGFGFNNMNIRGYELYAIDGQRLGLFKSNVKFEIIPRKEHDISWIKSEKFSKVFYALYANLFFDMGYADDKLYYENNPLTNQFLFGTGLGIDFVTYYDLVFRFEFSINKEGETGFRIGLVAPI